MRQNLYSVWTPILFFLLVRLLVAPSFELGVDEAHYVLYAKHIALSYFDHPPLVGWLHIPLTFLFGTNELTARIPAILLGSVTTYLVYKLVMATFEDNKAAFWAAVAINSSFIFGALFLMMMPDTILVFLLICLIFTFSKLLKKQTLLNYILFGLVLGACGLAKYTAIIFVFGILAYLVQSKNINLLFSKLTIASIAVSFVVISPVVLWNIDNNFASFTYQGAHVAGNQSFDFFLLAKNIAIQFLAYSPPLFIFAVYGLVKSYKSTHFYHKILFWIGFATILFFSFTAALKPALPHWISPFFVIFIPIGIAFAYSAGYKKLVIYSVGFSFLITVIVYAELIFKLGSFGELKNPFRDIYGWKNASIMASKLKPQNSQIAVLSWVDASRVSLYSNQIIYVADNRHDQFDIWYNQNPQGKNFVFVVTKSSHKQLDAICRCSEIRKLGGYNSVLNGDLVEGFEFVLCENFQGLK